MSYHKAGFAYTNSLNPNDGGDESLYVLGYIYTLHILDYPCRLPLTRRCSGRTYSQFLRTAEACYQLLTYLDRPPCRTRCLRGRQSLRPVKGLRKDSGWPEKWRRTYHHRRCRPVQSPRLKSRPHRDTLLPQPLRNCSLNAFHGTPTSFSTSHLRCPA